MKITVTTLALKRLFFLVLSAVIGAVISWVSKEPSLATVSPIIYFVLTTARDYLDKSIPNN